MLSNRGLSVASAAATLRAQPGSGGLLPPALNFLAPCTALSFPMIHWETDFCCHILLSASLPLRSWTLSEPLSPSPALLRCSISVMLTVGPSDRLLSSGNQLFAGRSEFLLPFEPLCHPVLPPRSPHHHLSPGWLYLWCQLHVTGSLCVFCLLVSLKI